MSETRKYARRQLDELYADLSPKERREFFKRTYERLTRWASELDTAELGPNGKIRSLKELLECFEKIASIQEKADKRAEPARKLAAALIAEANAPQLAIGSLKAALDEAMLRGDYKTAGALATQYTNAIGAAAPQRFEYSEATPAKAREHMRALFGGVTPKDASDTPEDEDPGKA
jgi:hypothetical protein